MEKENQKVTIQYLTKKKQGGKKITALTAYDYPLASFIDKAGIDMIIIGDSLGMVVLGYDSTLPVTMEEMLHHAKAVRRGAKRAFLVGDMPFLSHQSGIQETVKNADKFIKEAGCDAVKIEGGSEALDKIKAIIAAGIPVQGHLGLLPQAAKEKSAFKAQGRDAVSAQKILDDARLIESAGVFSVILECIPDELARIITQEVKIPTIGIGAGPCCDGQVLVTHDVIGLFEKFTPRFVKRYVNISEELIEAFKAYKEDVENVRFPTREHSFTIKKEEAEKLR